MGKEYYELLLPKEKLNVRCFVHEVLSFRYHWHADLAELNILLNGQQYFCRGKESHLLQAGDVIMIDPGVGHASYGQAENTIAMVLQFSSDVFRQFAGKGQMLSFPSCLSNEMTRNQPGFRIIKGLAANLIRSLNSDSPYAAYTAKASIEMMISVLFNTFDPQVISSVPEIDAETQKAMHAIMEYIETHYAEKISLEDIADMTGYNRTYISTLFHKCTGISFYDYLIRVRLQNALKDLVMTDLGLTDIALSNGFADSKSFNKRFRELLNCLPSEYRRNILLTPEMHEYHSRRYIPVDDPFVAGRLEQLMQGTL